jgi:hypothetical protein
MEVDDGRWQSVAVHSAAVRRTELAHDGLCVGCGADESLTNAAFFDLVDYTRTTPS